MFSKLVDIHEIVGAKSFENIIHDMPSNVFACSLHRAGDIHQDDHIFGAGRGLNVPRSETTVEQIDWLFIPFRSCVNRKFRFWNEIILN